MAKIRSIKPDFWEDEDLAKLTRECRLFYIGLWTFADDFGVIKANPVLLKSKVFPFDSIRIEDIKKMLNALEDARMLIPLDYKNESYYIIRTFRDHQKIDKRWERSTAPEDLVRRRIEEAVNSRTTPPADPPPPDPQTPPEEPPVPKEPTQDEKDFAAFQDWIKKKAPTVGKMKQPFTLEEYLELRKDFKPEFVSEMLLKMHNWDPLLKKNKSANLTFRQWAKKDYNQNSDGNSSSTSKGNPSGGRSRNTGVSADYQRNVLERLGVTGGPEEV